MQRTPVMLQPPGPRTVRPGPALPGGLIWLASVLLLAPTPYETPWAAALLLLAPLVLVPVALKQIGINGAGRLGRLACALQLPAALALGAAYLMHQGPAAAALALPWLVTTGLLTLLGLTHSRRSPAEWCVSAALVYISIGGFWAVLDRWGARPLEFEPVIVLLTAIHFHYAGFALPVLTRLAARQSEGVLPRLAVYGVVAAVPLVAFGITTTQLTGNPLLEAASSCLLAAAAALTGCLYFRLARQTAWPPLARALWAVAAVALTGSMVLAAAYGVRSFVPLPWLDIPQMRAWHGTANALGFGLAGLVGWALAGARRPI